MDEESKFAEPSLLSYTLRLFSKKSYTDFEIRRKCKQYFVRRSNGKDGDDDDSREVMIDKVVARLIELKYLDDERYAKDYINERIKFKPRGLFLIKRELKLKGIPGGLIEKMLAEAAIDELKLATELLKKKQDRWQQRTVQRSRERQSGNESFAQFDHLRAQKAKAASYLAGKGFKPDTVYKAIDHCYNGPDK